VVAVRLTSEWPGRVINLFKNIYPVVTIFLDPVTLDVFGTDRKGVCALLPLLQAYLFTPSRTTSK
jgi:hypothetical protein